jgi:membrane protein
MVASAHQSASSRPDTTAGLAKHGGVRKWYSRAPRYWDVFRQAISDFIEDRAMKLAASLAFYTMLSLAPLLVLAIKGVGSLFGEEAARRQVANYTTQLMGPSAASAISGMLNYKLGHGIIATTVSAIILIFSASAVFGELQDSLNTIWEVKPKPGRAIWGIIRDRFLSFTLVLGTCFLLLVSLVVSTLTVNLIGRGQHQGIVWETLNFILSLIIVSGLFALILKYLPDAKIHWRDVTVGAIATGVLFTVGKFALGWYLGRASTTSVYGSAGPLIAVLLWVYYSAHILFFGAELTQAYAHRTRPDVKPAENAVKVTEEERAQQGMPNSDRVEHLARVKDAQQSQPADRRA